jgi:hypothetical protein
MTHNKRVFHSACLMDGATDEVRKACRSQTADSPKSRSTPGLLKRKGIWPIEKVVFGKRLCESTRTSSLAEAAALLAHRVSQARKAHLYGESREHTFREARVKFLAENQHKRSIERDARAIRALDPFIGSLPLRGSRAPKDFFRID